MKNVAMLALYGSKLLGADELAFADIRGHCQSHACLDKANFATTIGEMKQAIVVSGTGKSRMASLTQPGVAAARALAESLNS